jgi:hypothetical protein
MIMLTMLVCPEGVLPRSLYFQFADRAIDAMQKLSDMAEDTDTLEDVRVCRMWADVSGEVSPMPIHPL